MDRVMSDPDLVYLILRNMDGVALYESCLGVVSKLFNTVYKQLLPTKIVEDVVDPLKQKYERYISNVSDMVFYIDFDTDLEWTIRQSMEYIIGLLDHCDTRLWGLALKFDSKMSEDLLYHLTFLNQTYSYYRDIFVDEIIDTTLYEQLLLRFDAIKPHLALCSVDRFNTIELEEIARFKELNVRDAKKNGPQLTYQLLRASHIM